MRRAGALALITAITLILSFSLATVSAQSETTNAEDGKPASDAPATTTVPDVPLGANLTPPTGALPVGVGITSQRGQGHSGTSSVSMAPGTRITGVANEDPGAVHAPEAAPAPPPEDVSEAPADTGSEPAPEAAPEAAPAGGCADFPTWYDAQLALESSVDPAVIDALDPDGDTIACEDLMYS